MTSGYRVARATSAFTLALAATAMLAGCDPGPPNQPDATVQTTITDAGTVSRSQDYTFSVTVSNTTSKPVEGVYVEVQFDPQVRVETTTCSASGGPTCPGPGEGNKVEEMRPGASITFTYRVMPLPTASGAINNVETTSIELGPTEPSITSHATVAETRNGHYAAFAADGTQFGLDIDFGADSVTFTGAGNPVVAPFTATATPFSYLISGNARFSTPSDLVVGSADFGQGPRPFVAARSFATTMAEIDGASFNTFVVDTSPAGAATSIVAPAWINGATLGICVNPTPHAASTCPAADQRQYALTLTGNVFTATDAAHGDTWSFQVAKSDASLILLSAGTTSSGTQFRIGLEELVHQAGSLNFGPIFGADNTGGWDSLELVGTDLAQPAQLSLYGSTDLGAPTAPSTFSPITDGPGDLLVGLLPGMTSQAYVTADATLAVLLGDPNGASTGFLAIFTL